MRETLPVALKFMFGHEGGYANRATDAGGPTKYGITYRTLADHRGVPPSRITPGMVKALTIGEAEEIYRIGYWTQSGGDILPRGLDYAAFDFGVNSGPATAVKVLQRLVGATPDGNAGPQTLAAVERYPGGVAALIRDYCDARMDYLRSLKSRKTGFPVNGRGWTIRVTGKDPLGKLAPQPGVVGNALELARGIAARTEPPAPLPVPAGGDAKATPPEPNPWTKPETLLQAAPVLGGLSFLATGSGPVQWAVGAVLVLAALVAAVFIIRRIRSHP